MSTSVPTRTSDLVPLTTRRGQLVLAAVAVTGVAFVVEAMAGVVVHTHIGYHALNTILNAALLVASAGLALTGRRAVGRSGVWGGWATAIMALLASAGGVCAVLVEGLSSGDSPGLVEGISHTAVLASLLFLVPLGLGLRAVARVPGYVIAGGAACCVVMVLVGLDQPEAFLLPEATLGLGWLLLTRSWPAVPGRSLT